MSIKFNIKYIFIHENSTLFNINSSNLYLYVIGSTQDTPDPTKVFFILLSRYFLALLLLNIPEFCQHINYSYKIYSLSICRNKTTQITLIKRLSSLFKHFDWNSMLSHKFFLIISILYSYN